MERRVNMKTEFSRKENILMKKSYFFNELVLILIMLLFSPNLWAQMMITDIFPPACPINEEFEVEITGNQLTEATRVFVEYDNKGQSPIIGSVETPGTANGITIIGNTVYIADGYEGLQIIDVSMPTHPKIIGNFDTSGYAYEVVVQNGTAYVADMWNGLQIIDVSNPTSPQFISSLYTQDYAYDLVLLNDIAYIADGKAGLQIADISDTVNPKIIGSLQTKFATHIEINGNLIFIADGEGGIKIIDATYPKSPQLISKWDTTNPVYALSIKGEILYFLEDMQSYGILHGISVKYPSSLREIVSDFIPGSPEQLEISSNTIYITMGLHGIETKGIEDINNLTHLGVKDISGFIYDLIFSNNIGYITTNEGLYIISLPFEIDPADINYNEPMMTVKVPELFLSGNYNFHLQNEYQTLTVSGAITVFNTPPKLWTFPSYIDFGRTKIFEPVRSYKNIAISNISGQNIVVENLYVDGSDFALYENNCSGIELKPNDKCYAKVIFVPEQLGNIETELAIHAVDNLENTPFIMNIPLSGQSYEEEIYRFDRMWPVLMQPWYFDGISDLAVGAQNFVYITNNLHNMIFKLTPNGHFVTQLHLPSSSYDLVPSAIEIDDNENIFVTDVMNNYFYKFSPEVGLIFRSGGTGNEDGQFNYPSGIAVNGESVYIAEYLNHRVQQFDAEGNHVRTWGGYGVGDGKFNSPIDIAMDSQGFIYVTDSGNNRIQKFDPDGEFIKAWGQFGTGESEFNMPNAIAIDDKDIIYISDRANDRIQAFSSDGTFKKAFGYSGWEAGKLYNPNAIAINDEGYLYIVDDTQRVQKFTGDGIFLNEWSSASMDRGNFRSPCGIAKDKDGFIYVADRNNDRIQKFASDGRFVKEWGNYGMGDGEFSFPEGIAISQGGYLYVADRGNNRIQKFTTDGSFVTKWGRSGDNEKEFDRPTDIAIDENGFVYVVDSNNHRIQKFTSEGVFDTQFGQFGDGEKEFYTPMGIAIDNTNHIYVADRNNHRIKKFDSFGNFIMEWGNNLSDDFFLPDGIAIDKQNYVYVADSYSCSIKKYTSDGFFIGDIGEFGYGIGQFNYPRRLCIDEEGKIYVTDENSRVQIFKKVNLTEGQTKAIIVAGRKSETDYLWSATQMCANFAYRSLTYQGFTKENIYYLSSDTELDLDFNGEADDVDGESTTENVKSAILEWANDAKSLVVYLVDHGGKGIFHLNETQTPLSAADLDLWLDEIQSDIPGQVIVIYDGCHSGTFISELTPPAGKQRYVITSASPEESAKFESQGSISYSFNFWNNVFNGLDIKESFDLAVQTITHSIKDQNPLIESNGNGKANENEDYDMARNVYIGNGTVNQVEAPTIQSVSEPQIISDASNAKIEALGVTDLDGIARVWAVIRPPNFDPVMFDEVGAILDLPSVELTHTEEDRYEGIYEHFHVANGTYQIAIYAMDRKGNTCIPKFTSVSVENPLRRRAILLAGDSQDNAFTSIVQKNLGSAYKALAFQGYPDEDIYLMSPVTIPASTKMPVQPELSNLEYALTRWASENTQDVVLYMIGKGGDSIFQMNPKEILKPSQLNEWLETLQNNIPGEAVVIYDSCRSGSFMPHLIPNSDKKRIVINSSTREQPACFLSEGDISFSQYFWRYVLKGTNIRKAFNDAYQVISDSNINQTPMLDDDGNGVGNEIGKDGDLAKRFVIGNGIMVASDEPSIGNAPPRQEIDGLKNVEIWADNIIVSEPLDKVWAIIIPPDNSGSCEIKQLRIELFDDGTGRYAGDYNLFYRQGVYNVLIYAKDASGSVSDPVKTTVEQFTDSPAIKGDINGDGTADLIDAVIALKVLANASEIKDIRWDYPTSGADVDQNGQVGMAEAIFLLQQAANLR